MDKVRNAINNKFNSKVTKKRLFAFFVKRLKSDQKGDFESLYKVRGKILFFVSFKSNLLFSHFGSVAGRVSISIVAHVCGAPCARYMCRNRFFGVSCIAMVSCYALPYRALSHLSPVNCQGCRTSSCLLKGVGLQRGVAATLATVALHCATMAPGKALLSHAQAIRASEEESLASLVLPSRQPLKSRGAWPIL